MNATKKTAGETAREIVAVCDVFDIRRVVADYATRGYRPTGEWCYGNRQQTIVQVGFSRPVVEFSLHDLLDDLAELLIRGRYSRREAERVLNVLQAQEGGAR